MSRETPIIVEDETYIYTIPNPYALVKHMYTIGNIMTVTKKNKSDTNNLIAQECKQFFIQNSQAFKNYLEVMMNENILPDNFHMFVENILNDIQHKHLQHSADAYWIRMLTPVS